MDREILRMLCEYATLNGTHPSMTRYRHALKMSEKRIICQEISRLHMSCSRERNRRNLLTARSDAGKAYRMTER